MNGKLIKELEEFFNDIDDTIVGEWNTGISQEDWSLLDRVKKALNHD